MSNIYNAPHPDRKPVGHDWGLADLPIEIQQALGGAAQSIDEQFSSVISAFAHSHNAQPVLTVERIKEIQREAKRQSPLHKKAVARRRKRKRGGPK